MNPWVGSSHWGKSNRIRLNRKCRRHTMWVSSSLIV